MQNQFLKKLPLQIERFETATKETLALETAAAWAAGIGSDIGSDMGGSNEGASNFFFALRCGRDEVRQKENCA